MGHFLPYSERKNFCWISFDVLLKTELDPVSQILTNILELSVSFHETEFGILKGMFHACLSVWLHKLQDRFLSNYSVRIN